MDIQVLITGIPYYLNEFSFRHNTRRKLGIEDRERAVLAVKGIEGKRLTYKGPRSAQNA